MDETLAAVVAAALLGVFLVTLLALEPKSRSSLLAFLLGASAGLFAAQIFQVHVFTVVAVLWAMFTRRSTGATWFSPEVVLLIAGASLVASTALFGQLVNSPTLGLQLLAFAFSASLIVVFGSADSIRLMLYGLLAVTSLASVWALMQVAGVVPNDAWHLDVSAIGRPTGIYPEPDWLGLFAGVGLVLAWRMPLRRWVRVVLIIASLCAWVLAFARAAWIAVAASTALAIVVHLLISRRRTSTRSRDVARRRVRSGRGVAVTLAVVLGIIAFETIPSLQENLLTRLGRTFTVQSDDISAQARVLQNDGLLHLAETAPWYGWGISSSGRVGVSGILNLGGPATNNLGSNWVVSMWVDGAWLSLPLIVILIAACALTVTTVQSQLLIVVLLSSFFSNAVFQPITWMLVGACLWYLYDMRHKLALSRKGQPRGWAGSPAPLRAG